MPSHLIWGGTLDLILRGALAFDFGGAAVRSTPCQTDRSRTLSEVEGDGAVEGPAVPPLSDEEIAEGPAVPPLSDEEVAEKTHERLQ